VRKISKITQVSMLLPVALMLSTSAGANVTTAPERLYYQAKALSVIPVDSLCYLPENHDVMVLRRHADLDTIASLKNDIRVLEADIVVLKHELRIAHLNTEEAQAKTEIAEVKRGGFWQRNFGRCFWTGAVAGAAGWELMDRE